MRCLVLPRGRLKIIGCASRSTTTGMSCQMTLMCPCQAIATWPSRLPACSAQKQTTGCLTLHVSRRADTRAYLTKTACRSGKVLQKLNPSLLLWGRASDFSSIVQANFIHRIIKKENPPTTLGTLRMANITEKVVMSQSSTSNLTQRSGQYCQRTFTSGKVCWNFQYRQRCTRAHLGNRQGKAVPTWTCVQWRLGRRQNAWTWSSL